jgi:DnaJ-class molecular chaperone
MECPECRGTGRDPLPARMYLGGDGPVLERDACPTCKGSGEVKSCPECSGSGVIDRSTANDARPETCPVCRGRFYVPAERTKDDANR